MESRPSNKDLKNSEMSDGKITSFFPVLRSEGRAKMSAVKAGDSKQKEMLQKLKNKETMSLRSKNLDGKSIADQNFKTDMPNQGKDKIGNVTVQSALKTPLSQVLRRSIEASEIKKEKEKSNQGDESSHSDNSLKQTKKESNNTAVESAKASKDSEPPRVLRRSLNSPHATKTFSTSLRSGVVKVDSEKKKNYMRKRPSTDAEASEPIPRKVAAKPVEDSKGVPKAKKGRRRHFRGGTYGLYLTKKIKRKKKIDDAKDDEGSLDNSSYLDSDEGNSEDFTPSEKSLMDEEQADSSVSPMPPLSERKVEQVESSSVVVETLPAVSENSESSENRLTTVAEVHAPPIVEGEDSSQNATEMLKELEEMAWAQASKFDDSLESSQFASETLKAPQYDDISNESFSNSTLFPFKTCSMLNSADSNMNAESNQTEGPNESSSLNINPSDFNEKEFSKLASEEISVTEENFSGIFENKESSDNSLESKISSAVTLLESEDKNDVPVTEDASKINFSVEVVSRIGDKQDERPIGVSDMETTQLNLGEIERSLPAGENKIQASVDESSMNASERVNQLQGVSSEIQLDTEETENQMDAEIILNQADEEVEASVDKEDEPLNVEAGAPLDIEAPLDMEEVETPADVSRTSTPLKLEETDSRLSIDETDTQICTEDSDAHVNMETINFQTIDNNLQISVGKSIGQLDVKKNDQMIIEDINDVTVKDNIPMDVDDDASRLSAGQDDIKRNSEQAIDSSSFEELVASPKLEESDIHPNITENGIRVPIEKSTIEMNENKDPAEINLLDSDDSPIKSENSDFKDADPDAQSTIANCVKSRQRIKRRFTDDIVDTDVGMLALHPSMAPRTKAPSKPQPAQDIIQNFQSVTHSEAKRGPISKIECIFNSRQKPIDECTCEGDTYEANLGNEDDGVFCQAVDSIDDKLVGCSNPVVTTRLVRPSVKIPFTIMCEMHLWRLKHHHSCPYCGLFCSQGYFMQCSSIKNKRRVVHLYHEQCQSREEGIDSFCLHCGMTTGIKRVELEMQMANPPSFFLSQLGQKVPMPEVSKARISFSATSEALRQEEEEMNEFLYRIEGSGKLLTAAGLLNFSEREALQKLLITITGDNLMMNSYSPDEFYDAASKGEADQVLRMLAQGFDPNWKFPEHENETALHAAAAAGHTLVVHLLIQAGAVNDVFNEKIYTPLMLAVESGHVEVVHYLVKKGALVDFKGENGMCSLHLAAKNGNLDILKILMNSRDIDVNSQDDGYWTPIVWASEHDHFHVVRYLLRRGANPNLKDNEGNTGLHWAAFSGSVDICYLYLDYGCDINAVNELGDTPLHIAARQDAFPCVTLFLSRGVDVSITNKAGLLPAECCLDKNGNTYMALSLNMLLKKLTVKYAHKAEKILHRDISRGKEQIAIQCVNMIDEEQPPLDFLYVTENCETMPIKIDRTITSLQSCHCEDDCSTANCSCSSISYQCWYDKEGLLLHDFNLVDPPMLFECNRACSCWALNCHNRVLQNGITSRLQLIRTKGKGWGVRTLKDIPRGAFICEYVGELISDSAADKRADDSYLFDLDNRDGETYCLDARYYGNISRFINHLCEPNLVPVKIYVDHQDLNFPRIAFFSSRDIKQYEELGFDYGEKFWAIKYKFFTCDCGSPKCKYSKETIHATIANYYSRLKEEQMEEAAAQQLQAQITQ
ncbi:histone-lysine N-methyltransferase EHMT1-like [Uloborus diversus]|uniref:histone-lysine N-methyltransferase EHMT1-like n=1 Tax=Uloborus diversus TaxID=327109 RepID=UPI0024096050|nr:histone-lysine N-methyltransferase EHMT1-like [Uloborus diversus]